MSDTSTTEKLRSIWEEVLGTPVGDLDADFFDLGGDSLLALAISTRAIESGLDMPRSAVLRRSTLRQLAEAVEDPRLFDRA
ncbi:acyl carrier protein [Kitasatospora sp. MBT66]|uniref:acyl carrier protein n=1 Tax=Kitasatospora sp. MBT66 TaxID=1444769 RepID=UPI0005BBD073|nr:phosphopantetheine-binding protein [Kitasatospora sp. MBT66]